MVMQKLWRYFKSLRVSISSQLNVQEFSCSLETFEQMRRIIVMIPKKNKLRVET